MEEHRDELLGIGFLFSGLLVLGSLISYNPADVPFLAYPVNNPVSNWISYVGVYFGFFFRFLCGYGSFLIPVLLVYWGWVKLFHLDEKLDVPLLPSLVSIGFFLFFSANLFSLSVIGSGDVASFNWGGLLGHSFASFLITYFGKFGAWVISIGLFLLSFIMVTRVSIVRVVRWFLYPLLFMARLVKRLQIYISNFRSFSRTIRAEEKRQVSKKSTATLNRRRTILPAPEEGLFREEVDKRIPVEVDDEGDIEEDDIEDYEEDEDTGIEYEEDYEEEEDLEEEEYEDEEYEEEEEEEISFDIKAKEGKRIAPPKRGEYKLPPIDLLDIPIRDENEEDDIEEKARVIEQSLAEFNIPVKIINVETGPVVTRYELEPAPGVKIQKIVNLSDDLALNLRASSLRIVAPIPGKGAVGIEVPNTHREPVFIRDIASSAEFIEMDSPLTLGLGKDTAGYPVVADLRDMPHLLIAGATGSGKTVCVNALIVSMLMKASPRDLRFIMVDPKMVEMAQYNNLPHLLCPVVTDAKKVSLTLNWLIGEMEKRYQRLAKAGVRNIRFYNERFKDEPMPYIVLIIDELADIMAVAQSEVETAIARLAQLSRAVGIHLILATQRPSVDVITGVIKANFPARISFKVASRVDSRTVLDSIGAEKLLGKGDMLFMKPGAVKIQRIQGAYVQDREIERIVSYISEQAAQDFDESFMKAQEKKIFSNHKDELFDDAVDIVLNTGQASVSILQRRMRLGYARAARLIDMMEEEGIVGPYRGSRPREILISKDDWFRKKEGMDVQTN